MFYLCACFQWTTFGSDNAALIIFDIHLEQIPALHSVQIHPILLRDADGWDKMQVIIERVMTLILDLKCDDSGKNSNFLDAAVH